jgi:hypothetical protein
MSDIMALNYDIGEPLMVSVSISESGCYDIGGTPISGLRYYDIAVIQISGTPISGKTSGIPTTWTRLDDFVH